MSIFNSRRGGALVLAAAVAFGTLFGSHRSLNAERKKVEGQNSYVTKDLETRAATASNLYTVASRYLPEDGETMQSLRSDLDYLAEDPGDVMAYADLVSVARAVFSLLEDVTLSDQDAKYVANFEAQIESGVDTIARDPYTVAAREFNEQTLGAFPASVLGVLTGVRTLPVYQ